MSFSCGSIKNTPSKAHVLANAPQPISVDNLFITPRYSTEINSKINYGADTLGFNVSSTYIYYPFGLIKSKPRPNLGLLKSFRLSNKIIKTDIGDIVIQSLKYGSSKIQFFYKPIEGDKHLTILKGEIYDPGVHFINGVKIGMSVDEFYKCFFTSLPSQLENNYHVFVLKSVDEVKHIYTLKDGKLWSVKFSSMRAFDSNY